jgi:hypothetical protein
MVAKEYWRAGEASKALKNLRSARPIRRQRIDILSWRPLANRRHPPVA